MRKEERYKDVLDWFQANVPVAETELHYNNPYELLVAVILSAQCTDKRVNMITPALFEAFPTPEVMAVSTPEVVYEYIKSVSYPNNKAKHLVGMAKMLVEEFKGIVPSDIKENSNAFSRSFNVYITSSLASGVSNPSTINVDIKLVTSSISNILPLLSTNKHCFSGLLYPGCCITVSKFRVFVDTVDNIAFI